MVKISGMSGVGKIGVERMPSSAPPTLLEIIIGTTFVNSVTCTWLVYCCSLAVASRDTCLHPQIVEKRYSTESVRSITVGYSNIMRWIELI